MEGLVIKFKNEFKLRTDSGNLLSLGEHDRRNKVRNTTISSSENISAVLDAHFNKHKFVYLNVYQTELKSDWFSMEWIEIYINGERIR